ncbi:MAG: hypothetical protein WD627_08795 [Actinomycetota bacterium]
MDATSGAAAVWWSVGLAVVYLVVIPIVIYLAEKTRRRVLEIKRYSDDVAKHGGAIVRNLEPVPALQETRELISRITQGLAGYVGSVDKLLKGARR